MAEGLIPFVYRAIKRKKSIRRYNSLPSAAAGAAAAAIVAAARIPEDHAVEAHQGGAYPDSYRHQRQPRRHSAEGPWAPATLELGGGSRKDPRDGAGGYQHRRWATVDGFAYEEEYRRQQEYPQQQPPLAKARSSRVFSCITGM